MPFTYKEQLTEYACAQVFAVEKSWTLEHVARYIHEFVVTNYKQTASASFELLGTVVNGRAD